MLPNRLLALTLLAALVVMSPCVLRAQWVQCSGPGGGSISTLGNIGPYVFAGTSGGLFRSTNGGVSWNPVHLGALNTNVNGIVASGSTIFVASDRLYYSTDSGLTWNSNPLPGGAGPLAILGRYLILASFDGVYRTSDIGATWENIGGFFAVSVFAKGSDLYVGYDSYGLCMSEDSGATWTLIGGDIMNGSSIQSLACAGDDIFAGGFYDEGFFRSTDNGVTWDTSDIGLPNNHIPNRIEDNFTTLMSLYQDGTTLFAGTTVGLYRSTDSGASWTNISSIYAPALLRSGDNLVAGGSGIMLSSDNGLHWKNSSDGISNFSVTALASVGAHLFVAIDGSGVYRSDDSGATLVPADSGIASSTVTQFVTIDSLLFAFAGTGLYRSPDLGDTWDIIPGGAFAPATAMGNSLITTNDFRGFILSTDLGGSWVNRSDGFHWGELVCLMSKGTDLYAGNSFGDCGTVYWSKDSALSWTDLEIGAGCTDVYSLCASGDYIFAGTGPGFNEGGAGMFRRYTTDTNWINVDSGLTDMSGVGINSIVSYGRNLFFGTEPGGVVGPDAAGIGVTYSSDLGTSWSSANEGLTSLTVPQLLILPPYIFAGTQSAGLWRRPLSDFVGTNGVTEAIKSKEEIISYPNPFTQSTQITFTSPDAGYAEISIVNLLGEQVARIFSGDMDAGEHNFTFSNTTGLPDGMYECLVRMNGRVETLPMVKLSEP